MSTFTPAEASACEKLIDLALAEDLGDAGDLTSRALIPADRTGRAVFAARSAGVLAGLPAVRLVAARVDPALTLEPHLADGAALQPGARVATLAGPMRSVLAAERTALNFLQRLSGVATQTRRHVEPVAGLPVKVLDTRKTTPGWRLLEKYAVRQGGGHNHRMGLSDGILIKDNHLAALAPCDRPAAEAVRRARAAGGGVPVEVEVDTLAQLDEVLPERPDIVLLDNMEPDQLRAAVARRDAAAPGVLLEASGGVTLATLRAIAETGVDRISIGALTHSAVALDIGLDYDVTPAAEWALPTRHLGRRVLLFDHLPSTNSLAAELAADPANAGVCVLAAAQTAGRGQYGRRWQAPPDSGVLLSVLLFPPPELRRPALLTAWAAVAAAETVRLAAGLDATIKWPNDLLVAGRKACGILIEQGAGTVVGLGLNVTQAADDFAAAGLPDATSLALAAGRPFVTRDVARLLIGQLDADYGLLLRGDFATLEASWKRRLGLFGRHAVAELADGQRRVPGRVAEVAFAGVDLEQPDGTLVRLAPEAVRHLHPA